MRESTPGTRPARPGKRSCASTLTAALSAARSILAQEGHDETIEDVRVIRQRFQAGSVEGRAFENCLALITTAHSHGKVHCGVNARGLGDVYRLLGRKVSDCLESGSHLVQLLGVDCILGYALPPSADELVSSSPHPAQKGPEYSSWFIDTVRELGLPDGIGHLVGADAIHLPALAAIHNRLFVTDLDPHRWGARFPVVTKLGPDIVTVDQAERSRLALRCDARVWYVTAMSMPTKTFDGVLAQAQAMGIDIVVYAVSCSHLASVFLAAGVRAVFAQSFPPIDMFGISTVRLFLPTEESTFTMSVG